MRCNKIGEVQGVCQWGHDAGGYAAAIRLTYGHFVIQANAENSEREAENIRDSRVRLRLAAGLEKSPAGLIRAVGARIKKVNAYRDGN